MTPRFYRLLLATGAAFAVSLALVVLDGAGLYRLPQPLRPVLLGALVLSTLAGIVLLSGAIGMPKNPRVKDPSSANAPEASGARASQRPLRNDGDG